MPLRIRCRWAPAQPPMEGCRVQEAEASKSEHEHGTPSDAPRKTLAHAVHLSGHCLPVTRLLAVDTGKPVGVNDLPGLL